MKIVRNGRAAIGLVLLLWLAACHSSGALTVLTPKAAAIPAGKVVALGVAIAEDDDDDDTRDAAERLRIELADRLVGARLFKAVVAAGQPADYRMTLAVSGVETVSDFGRVMFGSLAGYNALTAEVTLVDAASGATVTRFQVTGEAPSSPIEGGNGIAGAVRQAAKKTIEGLKG